MPKSIRIRTEPGVDRNINVKIDQDFDSLEILSLKLRQEDLYTQFCADYGVVVGRVIANGGFGIPNAHISIFIPLDSVDENDPIISTLYPYKTPTTKNEDGYRYNLLPYKDEYYGHNATGTFPSVDDVLTRKEVLQVYEKYYKYSVRTNDSGDFMIVGVPLGSQKIVMDLDLSNIGEFSLRPSDLIRMGRGVKSQFSGQLFKDSKDLSSLPQIVNEIKDIDVSSFWGQDEMCDVGITRVDFDLSDQGIEITPHSVFMGSIFSSTDDEYIKATCRPKNDTGNLCDTAAGPGEILAIRHTIEEDVNGDPVLEQYQLEDGGNVVDDNGAWLIDLPMNLDYMTTNEFGERVISVDPTIGIPTKSKYRFKIKWQNEAGLQSQIMRANYLIPNIKEHWGNSSPSSGGSFKDLNKSYSFSLDWSDYYDKDAAIKCEDTFYLFGFNKVYTTAAHIDRWKYGLGRASHYGIKEILDKQCASENNRFPINDGQRNFDFIYFVFNILLTVISPVIFVIIPIMHVLALLYPIVRAIVNFFITIINPIIRLVCRAVAIFSRRVKKSDCDNKGLNKMSKENPFKRLTLPMITYPDCEACSCEDIDMDEVEGDDTIDSFEVAFENANNSDLSDFVSIGAYEPIECGGGNECFACYGNSSDGDGFAEQYNMVMFSGYDPEYPTEDSYYNPGPDMVKSPFALSKIPLSGQRVVRTTINTSLPQSINLINQRERYFNTLSDGSSNPTQNRMRVEVRNNQFATLPNPPSNPSPNQTFNRYEDMPIIIVTDGNVDYTPGQLLAFVDSELIEDPNLNNTGLTVNQYGFQSISGTMVSNPSAYIQKNITYADPTGGGSLTKQLYLYSPIDGNSYNFKSGMEYYQVIGKKTIDEATGHTVSVSNESESILHNYLLDYRQIHLCQDNYTFGGNSPTFTAYTKKPRDYFDSFGGQNIYFLTRGVDPYSPRQTMSFDLSKLFGGNYGDPNYSSLFTFTGEYYPNIPIQENSNVADEYTPKQHFQLNGSNNPSFSNTNNTDTDLFHSSFLFTPSTQPLGGTGTTANLGAYSSFTSTGLAYYSSLGTEWDNFIWGTGAIGSNGETVDTDTVNVTGSETYDYMSVNSYQDSGGPTPYPLHFPQGRIDGASYQWTDTSPNDVFNNSNDKNYTVSPSYFAGNVTAPEMDMVDSTQLVFRSDRLPTSSNRETGPLRGYLQDFPLHLNESFMIFTISDTGQSTGVPNGGGNTATDSSGAGGDFNADPNSNALPNGVLESFTCNGLKVLGCYNGSGDDFAVSDPCDDDDRTQGGCYVFVDNPLVLSIPKDFKFFLEWRTRFRFMFGACRGVIGHMFQNNWVNGTLYMPSFQKKTFYDSDNEVKRYKFCGDSQSQQGWFGSDSKKNCGPIYFNTDTNSFFYRSAPYYQGNFKPQTQCDGGTFGGLMTIGANEGNIWQPTTIMDLGPKTDFLKEILLTPEFQGYIIDEVESTSYQDVSGILNLFIISRLIDASFLEQLLSAKDASIQTLFSRDGGGDLRQRFFDSRVDGDYAQMCSINTEFGTLPYLSGNYLDEISVAGGIFGIWFTGSTISEFDQIPTVGDRRILGPGQITFSENPTLGTLTANEFNYPGTQVVPFYTWEYQNGDLWGGEENTWHTQDCIVERYQDEKFDGANGYPKPSSGLPTGYIFNRPINDYPGNGAPNGTNDGYRVGSPFQNYFGLKKGKSAMNLFITKYMFNADLNG